MTNKKRLIVVSAPSGGGKSVVTRHIMKLYPNIKFSISATTRDKRPLEKDGKDYFFISKDEFKQKIENNQLAEWEEIFGNFYGTMKSEIQKALDNDLMMMFDIDVKGALSLKKAFPDDTILIFLKPLSIDVLEKRLKGRGTETAEQIKRRIDRANLEIELSKDFDFIIINDILEETFKQIEEIIKQNCV